MLSTFKRNVVKIIQAEYEKTDFLINRSQVSSSIFASGVRSLTTQYRYVQSLIEMDGKFYLLFDLDRYLSETFRVSRNGSAQLAVLTKLDLFSQDTARFLRKEFIPEFVHEPKKNGVRKDSTTLNRKIRPSDELVAFLITSNASVKEMNIFNLNTHPGRLQNHLMNRGIMATGFNEQSISFLIDLEKLLGSENLLYREEDE